MLSKFSQEILDQIISQLGDKSNLQKINEKLVDPIINLAIRKTHNYLLLFVILQTLIIVLLIFIIFF